MGMQHSAPVAIVVRYLPREAVVDGDSRWHCCAESLSDLRRPTPGAAPGGSRPCQSWGWALGTSSARTPRGLRVLEAGAGCVASKRWLVETASARPISLRPVRREWERSSSTASLSSIP